MEVAANESRLIRLIGVAAAALWMGSATMLVLPRAAHAQDDSAASSGDSSAATDNSDVTDDNDAATDTDADAADANVAPASIAGSWTGTVSDKRFDGGTFSITFTQSPTGKIVGVTVWELTFGVNSVGGLGNGHVKGIKLSATLDDNATKKRCRMVLSGKVTVTDTQEITGKYSLKGCFKPNSKGTFDLTASAS
jgi:hypothetical protein